MLEIPLFILVIQIGFNAALNNSAYSSNPLPPTARFANTAQTRRLADSDSYQPSRVSSASNEIPEPEYDSFEDYSFRSVQPAQNLYQRWDDYLRYNTRSENDISLETAPVGRINSNNYAESVQSSSSSSRRTHPNYRRPSSGHGPKHHEQRQPRKYYGKGNDDSSLDISSLESSNLEDASPEEDIDSLLSLIEQSFISRGQNRKYYTKGSSLSDDASSNDKLDAEEDVVHSPNSQNKRRSYRKEYSNQYDLRVGDSPNKDIPDGYIYTVLLVTDKNLPNVIPVGRPKLGSLDLDDDVSNNLSPFRGLKPDLKRLKLTNDGPLTRRFNIKSDDNLRSSFRDELFSDDDKTGQLKFLRLSSLEDLNFESPLLRSHDQTGLNNRKSNSSNFLRLSLSPNNKLTLDEGITSDLSELLSETLEELNLVPVSLRRTGPSSNKYSRRENSLSAEEDDLSNPSDVRLRSLDIPNSELPIRRYSEPVYHNRKNNLRLHGNNRRALKKLFDDDNAKTVVPYHEDKSKNLPHSRRNGDQNSNRRDYYSDEFSLDTLFDFRKEDHDDKLYLDDNVSSDLSVLRSTNQDLTLKSSLLKSSDENESKPTTDTLNLEYPWTDILGPKDETDGLRSQTQLRKGEEKDKTKDSTEMLPLEYPWTDILSPSKNSSELRSLTQLRNGEQEDKTNDSFDTLHLEFPWTDKLTPGNKLSGKSKSHLRSPKQKHETKDTMGILYLEYPLNDSLSPDNNKSSQSGLRSELRSSKEKDNDKDTTDVLHLEYPWNDQLSPDDNIPTPLRSHDQEDNVKDTADPNLELPWNDELSPDENKTGKSKSLRRQTDSRQDKEPKDELKLEVPWNDKTSPENPSSKKTAVRTPDPFYVHPYLRNRNIKKHPNYFRRSHDEKVRFENYKNRPLKRSNRRHKDNQNLRVLPIARAGPENYKTLFKDSVSVENPSAVITFPSDRIHKRLRVSRTRRQKIESSPLVTTTERPNNTDSLVNLVGDKSDKKTYNNTIIFPKN